jgi:hypothetical protein
MSVLAEVSGGALTVAVLAALAALATMAWMLLNRRHPENASVHRQEEVRGRPEPPTDRPADAAAESQVPPETNPPPARRSR